MQDTELRRRQRTPHACSMVCGGGYPLHEAPSTEIFMNLNPSKPERIENFSQEQILALMAEISREINGIHSLDELLEKIAELCRQFIDYQIFAILLVEDSKQDL